MPEWIEIPNGEIAVGDVLRGDGIDYDITWVCPGGERMKVDEFEDYVWICTARLLGYKVVRRAADRPCRCTATVQRSGYARYVDLPNNWPEGIEVEVREVEK